MLEHVAVAGLLVLLVAGAFVIERDMAASEGRHYFWVNQAGQIFYTGSPPAPVTSPR